MKLKFQLMKNPNIVIIACLAFLFITSSGCSKNEEEESPYNREQIIGRWYHQSFYIEDKYGNGKWEDEPNFGKYYNQYNADGTYYNHSISSNKSTWSLNGKNLVMKSYDNNDGTYNTNSFDIEELTSRILILKTKQKYSDYSKIKYINEKYINEGNKN